MRSESNVMRVAALTAAGLTLLAGLAACEEKPYALPVRQAEAPAPRATDLAGAPSVVAEAPPVAAPAAPLPEAAPLPPRPAYDAGEPQIVAMAPIPNPTEPARPATRVYRGRHTETWTVASSAPAHRATHRVWAVAPTPVARTHAARTTHAVRTAPAHRTYAQASAPVHARASRPPVVAASRPVVHHAAAPQVVASRPAAPRTINHQAVAPKVVASRSAAPTAPVAKAAPTTSRSGVVIVDKTADPAKVAALQSALTDAVSKAAVLTLPAKFEPGQPADVSLTLPADFGDTVRKQAQAQGLNAAAQTVNLNASLSGDGFTVTPADSQAQPLVAGQPTEFHWSAAGKPEARGSLRANVGADLLGGGDTPLQLGSVQPKASGQPGLSSQSIGVGLLVIIGVLVLAFFARVQRPAPPRRTVAGNDRPLDMTRPGEHHLDRG